jgi:rubredoxin
MDFGKHRNPTVSKKEASRMANPEEMWQCQTLNCGYIYNPDKGDRKGKIPKGTLFEDLPDDWKCPICGASKKMFRPLAGPSSVAAEGS